MGFSENTVGQPLRNKLLWFDLNASYAHSSLALPAIHAQLPEDGSWHWEKLQGTINMSVGNMVTEIVTHRPRVLAATVWLFTHEVMLKVLSRVKSLLPECVVILGGPEMLGDNESYLRTHPFIDVVFRGEGEIAFHKWLQVYREPSAWFTIPGCCWLDEEGCYHDTGCARVDDFASLNPPEKSCFFDWSKPFVQLETTRGCYNSCAFCVSGREEPVSCIPVEEVRKRLELIRSRGIKDIRLLDRTFNAHRKRTVELLQLFREFHPDLHFHLEIHPGLLEQEVLELLNSMPAGLLHLEAGIQSLRERVLLQSTRKGDMKRSVEGIRLLAAMPNLVVHVDLIAGLPEYSWQELQEDVLQLLDFGPEEIQLELLKVLPGTVMRDEAITWGLVYAPDPPYEILQTPHITPEELQQARLFSRMIDGFYNAGAWQEVFRLLTTEHPEVLADFFQWLLGKELLEQPLSLEKRGVLLYEFCACRYPAFLTRIVVSWISAGIPFAKAPGKKVEAWPLTLPDGLIILKGTSSAGMRFYCLPGEGKEYFFGFDRSLSPSRPLFIAEREC